jgi:dipeptidyl aminopeptidase/acylaminoacyl peptidase
MRPRQKQKSVFFNKDNHRLQKKTSLALFLCILFLSACGSPIATSRPPQTSIPLTLPPTWTPTPAATAISTFTAIPTFTAVPAFTPLASPTYDAMGALLENFQDSLFPRRGRWAAYREQNGLKVINGETKQVWTLPCELFNECSILFPIQWSRDGRVLYFAPAPAESGAPAGIYLFSALAMIEVKTGKWEMLLPDSNHYYDFMFSPDQEYLAYTQSRGKLPGDPTVTVGFLKLKNKKGSQHNLNGRFAGNIVWSPFRPRFVFQIQDPNNGSSVVYFDVEANKLKYVLREEQSDVYLSRWDQNNLVSLQKRDWKTHLTSDWLLNPFTGELQRATSSPE